ncbi:hypothetical protein EDF56_1011027 [Novosphingobium sp. PhB165]|uniref:hypothetical protein n=1 Tax=Novosphingobium sp. PhB165 TaxID=2485105 RepID=UPI00104A2BFB|nr:hypothetical protein [Novosphingobium sp. PhB165]TCM22340.1 hypothetical protein EDF56_1011027 [Novosphingobium sp. PhB165]
MKKSLIAAALAAATLVPAAAMAQAAPAAATPTAGAKVYDPEGNEVGSVEAVQGDVVTLNTGTARAGLPKSAFATRDKGLTIGMTKAQLEAAVQGAQAKSAETLSSALVVDAPVKSADGVVLGTVSKVDGDNVTVALKTGSAVALQKSAIGVGTDGTLALGVTAAQFNSQVQAGAAASGAGK